MVREESCTRPAVHLPACVVKLVVSVSWVECLLPVWSLSSMSSLPLVVVLGRTGTGKTKLAVQLAKHFGRAQVVNADAMQVYRGLPVATNKATPGEMQGVQHHLIGEVDPLVQYTVTDYQRDAVATVERITSVGDLAILCGGTAYYVESVLWNLLLGDDRSVVGNTGRDVGRVSLVGENCALRDTFGELDNMGLYQRLREVDPEMAQRIHPNNRRKVLRALEVFAQHGKTQSALLHEQRSAPGAGSRGGPLRYLHACIFLLGCDQRELDQRLDARVDAMLRHGLLPELEGFLRDEVRTSSPDYTRGLLQCIGFKEFHAYLALPAQERAAPRGAALRASGVAAVKQRTRAYARKQQKWIRMRFLERADRPMPPVYVLDTSDVAQWSARVLAPAVSVLDAMVKGGVSEVRPTELGRGAPHVDTLRRCDVCDKFITGDAQWENHLRSKGHRARGRKKADKLKLISPNDIGELRQAPLP